MTSTWIFWKLNSSLSKSVQAQVKGQGWVALWGVPLVNQHQESGEINLDFNTWSTREPEVLSCLFFSSLLLYKKKKRVMNCCQQNVWTGELSVLKILITLIRLCQRKTCSDVVLVLLFTGTDIFHHSVDNAEKDNPIRNPPFFFWVLSLMRVSGD